jgi:hypothetical protein
MSLRDHEPITYDEFNGLWARGDFDSCPPDHFTACNNIDYSETSVITRGPFTRDYSGNILMVRQRLFITNIVGQQTIFSMGLDAASNFYKQQLSPALDPNPIQLIPPDSPPNAPSIRGNPIDFDLVNINGRAYITFSYATVGLTFNLAGFSGWVYIYDGVTFRVAGNSRPLLGAWNVVAGGAGSGSVDMGYHSFAVAFESSSGAISALTFFPAPVQFVDNTRQVQMTNIPVDAGTFTAAATVARRIYATKANAQAASLGQYYLVTRIADNVTAALNFTFFDSQLLENDTFLTTSLDQIPCGVGIGKYHNRLVLWGFPYETITIRTATIGSAAVTLNLTPSTVLFSNVNAPEIFDTLNNLVILDANAVGSIADISGNSLPVGITAGQEYRDIFYAFKLTKTYALQDNQDVPATWPVTAVDEGSGAFVKGVSTVLDTSGVNYEYLVVSNVTGMYTFNGLFVRPELTWKIADLWKTIFKTPGNNLSAPNYLQGKFHTVLDTINKKIYILLTFSSDINARFILLCDFTNTFIGDPNFSKSCKWALWSFSGTATTTNIYTLFGWDTGTFLALLGCGQDGGNYIYNGGSTTRELVLNPFFQSNYITDDNEGIIHLAGIRFRVTGLSATPSNLTVTVFGEDKTQSNVLAPLPITLTPGISPTLLANFISQKILIRVTAPNGGYFNINKIFAFVKSIYAALPQ